MDFYAIAYPPNYRSIPVGIKNPITQNLTHYPLVLLKLIPLRLDAPLKSVYRQSYSYDIYHSSRQNSVLLSAALPPSGSAQEPIRHMLFGSLSAVQSTIRLLYRLNYAEPNDWSQPISTAHRHR